MIHELYINKKQRTNINERNYLRRRAKTNLKITCWSRNYNSMYTKVTTVRKAIDLEVGMVCSSQERRAN